MTEIDWPDCGGYTIFCDDLRQEVLGKWSFMGAYHPDILLDSLPAVLPTFGIFVTFFETSDLGVDPLELLIFLPGDADDSPTHKIPIQGNRTLPPLPPGAAFENDNKRCVIRMPIKFAPLALKEEGLIKVRMARGDMRYRIGALMVRIQKSAAPQN